MYSKQYSYIIVVNLCNVYCIKVSIYFYMYINKYINKNASDNQSIQII